MCFCRAEVIWLKFSRTFPLRVYWVTVLASASMIVRARTPSSLGSSSFLPAIFFSWLAPSCASIHSNTGTAPFLILLTVFSLTPQRRSLIRIRRYQPFHCCSVLAERASSIAVRASSPVSWRVLNKWHSSLNAPQGSPCPSGPLNEGTFFTPKVM